MNIVYENVPYLASVTAGESLTVRTDGLLLIEAVSGLGVTGTIASGVYGTQIYGPWATDGVIRLTATKRDGEYSAAPMSRVPFFGMVTSGQWVKAPSIFRLRITGTGTMQMDSRDSPGNTTLAAFPLTSYTAETDKIEFPYAGDDAVLIRFTLTGSLTCEVI